MDRFTRPLLFLLIIALSACTTQKSRKDQSLLSRLYHNTTAHYNGYFNADEIMVASINQLDNQFQDNYNKLLPVYKYIEADNPQAVGPDLDEAIKKVSVVVNLHRQSVWTDDCYLLLGKAQFLKKDYEGAEETFRYMVAEFDPSDAAAAKQRAKNRAAREKPSRAEAAKERQENAKQKLKQRRKDAKDRSKARKKEKKEREKAQDAYNRLVAKNRKLRKQGKPTIKIERPGAKEKAPTEEIKDLAELEKPKEEEPPTPEEEPEPESPSSYFLKHRPVFQESVLWLARTLIERDNHEAALRFIAQLENNPALFSDISSEIAIVKAYLFIDLKKFEEAIAHLEQAIELGEEREKKARYAYILAQIHQNSGRKSQANEAFTLAEKYTQNYEMRFSANLNQVLTSNVSIAEAQNELEKMLKDSKNLEFLDQIYYTLGEIALNAGQREKGIEYLEKSLQSGLRNPAQRTESYYRLAELYFEDEFFVPAKNYFDSTLQVMPETDERHLRVSLLAENLSEIAQNLEIIERQDSLLRISTMSPDQRRDLAAKIKLEEDEARRREIAAKSNPANQRPSFNTGANALQKESTFFAYDERNLKRRKRDFIRKWGDRPLQDNWRRSSEIQGTSFEIIESAEEVIANVLTDEDIEAIFSDVPNTEEGLTLANLRIQDAMFSLGALYRDRLENYEKAIEVLEELNVRYPGSNKELDSWYLLYLCYTAINNSTKAREYYDKIIEKHPQSKYALVLKDPSYADKLRNKELEISLFYDDAYTDFTKGEYKNAYTKVQTARQKFGSAHTLQPKYALLAALCTGNLQGRDQYVKALTEVVAKYPNTDEQRRAREILRLLGEWRGTLPGEEKIKGTQFTYEPDQLHYIVVNFQDDVKLNDVKAKVSDFNRKYFELEKLRISNIFLGTDINKPIIVVRRFKNRDAAIRYYNTVQKNAGDFIDPAIRFDIFAITQNNYREILKAKSLDGYKAFFDANYF